jgi:hypothetical protein
LPQSNANCYAGKPDTNGYGHGYDSTSESHAHSYSHGHNASSLAYAHCDRDGDGNGDNYAQTYANTEVAAYAISSADSVRALSN